MRFHLGRRCNVCGSVLGFRNNDPLRPRESYTCIRCGTNSRQRLLVYFLGCAMGYKGPAGSWPGDKSVHIFESSGMRGYPPILAAKYTYLNTEFDPDITAVEGYDNTRFADLQKMPYPDGMFNVVLSSDVLEHVRDYKKALSEIHRVLKTGGHLLLQVPYDHEQADTLFRIKVEGDNDIYLMEPYYHAVKYLVYRDYGRDLLGWIKDAGFSVAHFSFENSGQCIPRQDFIVASKSDILDFRLAI